MADLSNVKMEDLVKGLCKIAKKDVEGKYSFDVTVFDEAGNEALKCGIVFDNGSVEVRDGESGEDDAVLFHIKKGGVETMKAMQVDGLEAAMRFMFDGSIYTTNPAGAEKWFQIFELGEAALEKALS
ncbi:MAG TPA: hypothetical protein PKH33_03690 [bacterium]|nr:hypothetical protein [bacterium]